ncbi:MAG TPA: 2-amino-4-hydroxy-6-hydroxymethyldihydropteridine diphosphokinase [Solirubrobacteraceae bacterium]|nr:2-amino-4-hydroxy-6-hydroxymethyldihydropteridine diphosphokinase [Solirubrobacteraceae bacterium]
MRIGYLGLGSNVGDRRANLQAAVDALPGRGVEVLASSSTYGTDPVGEILDQPEFLNACLRVRTELEPEVLLDAAKAIEGELGRVPGPKDGPRPIDIDLLLLGDVELAIDRLRLPHDQVLSRRFVLIPLLELDLDLQTPSGERLADALAALPVTEGVRREGPPLQIPNVPPMSTESGHGGRGSSASEVEAGRRRTPAEEARTLVSAMTVGYLATVNADGDPWCSLVVYGPTAEGNPVLLVSTMAEHGRNLVGDPRASLAISDPSAPGDPLDRPRITLAGRAVRPEGDVAEAALDAHVAAIPGARLYAGWDDFSVWVLEVQRVRWVGGFAQMDTVTHDEYVAAEPDPTAPAAAANVAKLNKESADGLLAIAREVAGARGAVSAIATGLDRYGLDLSVTGAGQAAAVRVAFESPLQTVKEIRTATQELVRRAYASQARAGG